MGSTSTVITVKEFDINKLSFGDVKKLENNGKYIPMYYNKSPFVIQTPQCHAPYGMNVYRDEKTGNESFSLELSFKDRDSRPTLQRFFEILNEIDNRVLEETMKNSQAWIRKPPNRDVIEALFTPTIKYPKDKETGEIIDKYPPTYRVKLKKNQNGAFRCECYDHATKEDLSIEAIMPKMKGSKITSIANCSGVWLAGGKFGISWNASQLLVAVNTGIKKFAFRDLEDDDGNSSPENKDEEITTEVSNDVDTSDDEEEVVEEEVEEEEVEEEVEEEKPAKKKGGRGKK